MSRFKPSEKSLQKFMYFLEIGCGLTLNQIPLDKEGYSAAECFHAKESLGMDLPCRNPSKLVRAINGKRNHGWNVTMLAEGYLERTLLACDLDNYPEWVKRDILGRARQLAVDDLGYVPKFVSTADDFSTLQC